MLSPCSCCHTLLSLTALQSSFILTPVPPSPYPNQLPPAQLLCLFFPWLDRESGLSSSWSLPKRLSESQATGVCHCLQQSSSLSSSESCVPAPQHLQGCPPTPSYAPLQQTASPPQTTHHPLLCIYLLILTRSPLPSPLIGPPNRFSDPLFHDIPLSHLISLLWD